VIVRTRGANAMQMRMTARLLVFFVRWVKVTMTAFVEMPPEGKGAEGACRIVINRFTAEGARLRNRFLLAACLCVMLIPSGRLFAQYRSTQWTAESGLPQNSVRGIVQTPDGYLWLATLNGAARFDGIRFTVFNKSNTAGITSNRFTSMVGGQGGDLWLASEDNNLIRYHDGHFSMINEQFGIRLHSIGAITADEHGIAWVLSDEHAYSWDAASQRFERLVFDQREDDPRFATLWWVGTGFWALSHHELLCLTHGHIKRFTLPFDLDPLQIRDVAAGGDGTVWVATHDGRFGRLSLGQYQINSKEIITPFISKTRQNWTVSISQNFARTLVFPSGGLDRGIPYNVLFSDDDDNIWVGSEGEGLFRVQRQSIKTFTTSQGLASDNVYPVLRARNDDIWAGSWPAGLTLLHDNRVVNTLTQKDGLPGLVTALAEDKSGALWIGTHNGIRVLAHGHLSTPRGLPNEMSSAQVIFQTVEGAMLLGTPKGLYVLDGENSHWLTTHNGLAGDDVRVIISDHSGDIWLGGYGGVTRIHHGQFQRWTEAEGLPSNNIRSIMEDSAGEIWIGTYDGGLGWFRNGKWVIFNQDRGLFDNGVFQILEDSTGSFWMSSNNGIYRVRRSELQEVADGKRARVASIAYGRADGMLNVECNGGLWPAGAKDDKGALWFPTQKGLVVIDPTFVKAISHPPSTRIESIFVDHAIRTRTQPVVLHPGETNLVVEYTALSSVKPEQISFRYIMEGVDDSWQEVGTRRTAYYSHLAPGEYTFRVSARNSDGVSNRDDATLLVTVVPPFYRRPWFILLIAGAILLAVRLAWTYRVRQLTKAQAVQQAFSRELIASQEKERRRIAGELHDSLGQRLIVIKNLALFLLRPKNKLEPEENKRQRIEEISSEATAAMEETRAISYDLRPFQLDRLGLSKAIEGLVRTASLASGIQFTTELGDIDIFFRDDLRINFFRIVQEGLNNIVKHSQATKAMIAAEHKDGALYLTISDNGNGLPDGHPSGRRGPGGFGLIGINERASLLNGNVRVRSQAGLGTELTIMFLEGKESLE